MRLRCRAHNQYAAACAFGSGFMERKRQEARRGAISSATIPEASLEERIRIALRSLAPAHPRPVARIAGSPG